MTKKPNLDLSTFCQTKSIKMIYALDSGKANFLHLSIENFISKTEVGFKAKVVSLSYIFNP